MKKLLLLIGFLLVMMPIQIVSTNSSHHAIAETSTAELATKNNLQSTPIFYPQSIFLEILSPVEGDVITGKVKIEWRILSPYDTGSFIQSHVYYSPDAGINWIQLAFAITETSFTWETKLYEKYGNDFKIAVEAESKDWAYNLQTISEGTFTINNRLLPNFPIFLYAVIPIVIIAIGFTIGFVLYRTKQQKKYSFDLNKFDDFDKLKALNHKVIIGLDYAKDDFDKPLEISLVAGEDVSSVSGSIVNYFPIGFQSDLKSEIKGRTVMVLIEIAYQNPSETNPVKIADGIGIPLSTLSKEIKKLVRLNYVESHVSHQVLLDTRYRNFKLTTKGFEFLNILNVVLKNTIKQIQTRNGIV